MKRGNMLKRLKKRLGANGPGLTVAVVAMLVALTGGAFAASGALTSTQKKQVKAIVKKEAKTIAGPAGAQGPAGPTGAKGDKGASGDNGKSVVIGSTPSTCGTAGGKTVEVEGAPATKKDICNGEDGSPWTVGGVLPPGEMETGAWAFAATTADTEGVRVAISFPIPLPSALPAAKVHWAGEADFTQVCPGTVEIPNPKPGELCVYANFNDYPEESNLEGICPLNVVMKAECIEENKKGTSKTGAVLLFSTPTSDDPPEINTAGSGAFAVRAPEGP